MSRLSIFGRAPCVRMPAAALPAVALVGVLIGVAADAPVGLTRGIPAHDRELSTLALPDGVAPGADRSAAIPSPLIDPRKSRVQRWRIVHPGVVRSRTGASARVAQRHTARFQCLVDWLDEQGFRIVSMGGI